MNTINLSHNECRNRVCIVCYKKGKRPISDAENVTIQKHILVNYDKDNIELPNAVCLCCSIVLSNKIKDESTALPTIPNYDPELPKLTRGTIDNKCTCRICKVIHFSTIF